jgi:hypothetical protein
MLRPHPPERFEGNTDRLSWDATSAPVYFRLEGRFRAPLVSASGSPFHHLLPGGVRRNQGISGNRDLFHESQATGSGSLCQADRDFCHEIVSTRLFAGLPPASGTINLAYHPAPYLGQIDQRELMSPGSGRGPGKASPGPKGRPSPLPRAYSGGRPAEPGPGRCARSSPRRREAP